MTTDYRDIFQDEHNPTAKAKKSILVDGTGTEISSLNPLPTTATITTGDIEIGAVEIKNSTDDTRAVVKSDGTNNALVVVQNTQPIPTGASTSANQDTIISNLQTINSLVPSVYDFISLGYTGSNLTSVIFKSGGSGGTTISTLTLAYSGSDLVSITKT